MCDLWKNTLEQSLPPGNIPDQIRLGLAQLKLMPSRAEFPDLPGQIKLYNSGSFFDSRAIALADYDAVATQCALFERVVVEAHPALVGENCWSFRKALARHAPHTALEVALGLETVHPRVLPRLNKNVTLDQFRRSAALLSSRDIALRVFVLVQPPFMRTEEVPEWTQLAVNFAWDCGATVVSLIPTRGGNGAMERLADMGEFVPPTLASLENALAVALAGKRGRVFADLWNLETFSTCSSCFPKRRARLTRMNLSQEILPPVDCDLCGNP